MPPDWGRSSLRPWRRGGYPKPFAVAVTSASSTIGPIFPPSLPFVVFSFVSGVSVGRLFLGGVVPGVLMTAILMLMVAFYSKKNKYPRQPFSNLENCHEELS